MAVDRNAPMGHNRQMHTVVEMQYYAARAAKLLSPEECAEVIAIVAADPNVGDIISGAGEYGNSDLQKATEEKVQG